MEASEGDKSTLQQCYRSCYTAGLFVAETAVDLIPKADWAVVSLQGQQLLQSSTSLLLTCNSMLLSWSDAAFPGTLSLCVRGLPLLHLAAAQAAPGDTSCGMSQSLAASLALAGRCLVALGTGLSYSTSLVSSSSSIDASQVEQGLGLRSTIQWWLMPDSSSAAFSMVGGVDIQTAFAARQASIAQQMLPDLLNCVQSIIQELQQRAAFPTVIAAAEKEINMHTTSSQPHQIFSSFSGSSRSSSSACSSISLEVHCSPLAGSAGDAVQHDGFDQQQQQQKQQEDEPTDWLLAGLDTAQSALKAALLPFNAALAPYLQHWIDPLSVPASPSLLSLPALLIAAGEALCAAVPSSACCSNPRCNNLSGVSAGFALVRGKGCVCGGCLGLQVGGEAAVTSQGAHALAARWAMSLGCRRIDYVCCTSMLLCVFCNFAANLSNCWFPVVLHGAHVFNT